VGTMQVRLKNRTLGSIEEMFVRQLKIGDVFVIAGRPVRLERTGLMEVFVSRADSAIPTIPRWNASKMPLSNNVAQEIISFRAELRAKLEKTDLADSAEALPRIAEWIASRLDCGKANAQIILRMYEAQHRISEIPAEGFLLVEELLERSLDVPASAKRMPHRQARHYFFHSLIGRAANDALSRVITYRLSKMRGGNAIATPHDYGFVLTLNATQFFTAEEIPRLLTPDNFLTEFQKALSQSDMLKYHFRNAAQTGLMVYRNYFSDKKSVRKLQWSSEVIFNVLQQYEPDHILLREAERDSMHTFLDASRAHDYLRSLRNLPVKLHKVDRVPPLSFAMYATKIKEALLVEDPAETMERLFHLWWAEIETDAAAEVTAAELP
jgi:ATP-dependent helicase Lhr and Lhr-like helicase